MRIGTLCAAAMAALLAVGCGSNTPPIGITVSPLAPTVILSGTQQFTAAVTGTPTTTVNWSVCTGPPATGKNPPPVCNNPNLGTISATGLYTAPSAIPTNPTTGAPEKTVTITATSTVNSKAVGTATVTLDSGIRVNVIPSTEPCTPPPPPQTVTIGTNETFTFTACVTGTSNTGVNWTVTTTPSGATCGTIDASGKYTAPATPCTATVTATSAADPTELGTANVNVLTAAVPTLTGLSATAVPQGSIFQDIYLSGSNFFSTSTVLVNGSSNDVTTTFISTTFLRGRLDATLLGSTGLLTFNVRAQNGNQSGPQTLSVAPVRPAVISSSPESLPQNAAAAATTVSLHGGYFSNSTLATFDGVSKPVTVTDSRNLGVVLSGSDLGSAGLIPLVVQNQGIAPGAASLAAINLAVVPPASALPSSAQTTLAVGASPSAVAIDAATGIAIVANSADGTVSFINLNAGSPVLVGSPLTVGKNPTGVAVDNLNHRAFVVNNGDPSGGSVSVVDLQAATVTSAIQLAGFTPANSAPFSIGVNPITQRGIIANQSTNTATMLDLSANPPAVLGTVGSSATPVSAGQNPQVAVDPRLNRAIITPGGAGTISIVDLGRPSSPGDPAGRIPARYATLTITTSIQGVAINPETRQVFLTDPNNPQLREFSELDQSVAPFSSDMNEVAAAVNPLTDIGVTVNPSTKVASVFDLRTQQLLGTVGVGAGPQAVAIDPGSDTTVVANRTDNSVSIFSLGAIRSPQITQASPVFSFVSANPLALTILGDGFTSSSQVRLDETQVASVPGGSQQLLSSRKIIATVPPSMLGSARLYAVDVMDTSTGQVSNVAALTVIQTVGVGNAPQGVAVDSDRDIAVVTNSNGAANTPCPSQPLGTVSIVNLLNATANPEITVGCFPQGVALLPRVGRAVLANNGSDGVSVVDYVNQVVVNTFPSCTNCFAPFGVAINPDTARALVANASSNNVSFFATDAVTSSAPPSPSSFAVDQRPVAVAVDPVHNIAAVASTSLPSSGTPTSAVDLVNLSSGTIVARITTVVIPTGVVFDPVSVQFVVADSLDNSIVLIDPVSHQVINRVRVGINPTSLDNNFQTGTLVTVNSASNTISVVDSQTPQQTKDILDFAASSQFSVAIDTKMNLAVVVDANNNRLLLIPLP